MLLFSETSRSVLGSRGILFNVYRGLFGGEVAEASSHLHLMSRLRMSGDMPVLSLYSYLHREDLILDYKIGLKL
jgi:hypothetical protein